MKKTVLIIFGGKSTEHDVSLVSAASVIRNIPRDKYDVLTLGITKEGEWFLFDGSADEIESGAWLNGKRAKAFVSPDAGAGLALFEDGSLTYRHIDVIFPVLHGKNGEDGTVQGLFELSGIPYVGCGHLSSAVTMDKQFTNLIADFHSVKQAKWTFTDRYAYVLSSETVLNDAERKLGYPIFVKPANAGSSVGITKAHDRAELSQAVEKALAVDSKVIFEETIVGKEIECAVLGNDEPIVSVAGEIAPAAEFYDYDAKYVSDSKLYIPARLDEKTMMRVRAEAIRVFRAMDATGFSRVDFFVTAENEIYFNEINTIPGFTSISMYPKLFEASGIPYPELIDRLLELAIERYRNK
ncbi:MAG: D-alanine--D-alanine ligase [Clostridia bacterium]|nr:D-alanine--D-alanine ligase [Clostridia bacterium]